MKIAVQGRRNTDTDTNLTENQCWIPEAEQMGHLYPRAVKRFMCTRKEMETETVTVVPAVHGVFV